MEDDKQTALLGEIRDLLKQTLKENKESRDWMFRVVGLPTYALLVILIVLEIVRR